MVDWLRERGVALAFDHFGSGHSSLLALTTLDPKQLKIAPELTARVAASVAGATMARKVIEIGQSLKMEVVAEGVETEDAALALAGLGCDALQGDALAPPMDADELLARLSGAARDARRSVSQNLQA